MERFIKMKTAFAHGIRGLMHDVLFIVCALLSIGMFVTFGNSWWTIGIMGLVAMVFESTKLYSLLKTKKFFEKKDWSSRAKGFFFGTLYIAFAILSIAASVMFALNLLAAKETIASVSEDTLVLEANNFDEEIEYWRTKIDTVQEEIEILNEEIANTPDGWSSSVVKINTAKESLKAEMGVYEEKWQEAKSNKTNFQNNLKDIADEEVEINPADGYARLAEAINLVAKREVVTEKALKTLIFLVIMFLLEVSVAVTSGNLPKEEEKIVTVEESVILETPSMDLKETFIKVIEAMYFEIKGTRLNSVGRISRITGLEEGTCWKIKKSLMSMEYKNKPLLFIENRRTQSRVSKTNMIKIAVWLLNNPHDGMFIPELP